MGTGNAASPMKTAAGQLAGKDAHAPPLSLQLRVRRRNRRLASGACGRRQRPGRGRPGDLRRRHHRHRPEARAEPAGGAHRGHHPVGGAAGRRGRAGHQGSADPDARPDGDLDPVRGLHHCADPRRGHRGRQPGPGKLGRRGHRRGLSLAQLGRLRRPGRTEPHRGAERAARHAVRQEHLGRRHQHHHRTAVVRARLRGRADRRQLWRDRRIGVRHRPLDRPDRRPAVRGQARTRRLL